MAVDMKEIIAEAAGRLIRERKVKKLTVKDIVEECNITRQTFYYHFEDIPDLLRWVLKKGAEHVMKGCREQEGPEEMLRYLFLMLLNARPYVRRGMTGMSWSRLQGRPFTRSLIRRPPRAGCTRTTASGTQN